MEISWYHAAISIATICILAVNGQVEFAARQCGCLEVPVSGPPRRENFCRWKVTPSSLLYKDWHCVCRPGMVRNAWGDCITKHECKSCKCFWYKDFNVCGRDCPLKCGEPIRTTCSQDCAFGCDCPPGRIRTSSKTYCVKTSECTPICPANSRYTSCLSNCAPKCGKPQPPNCITRCRRGGCACNEGYAEADQGGVLICVPQQECSRYAPMGTPFPPNETGGVGGSGGSLVTPGQPGGGTVPTVPEAPPAAPAPPPGAEGSFPSGRPSHETTGHGGGIAALPPAAPPQGTPVSPPGGHGSTSSGLAFPSNPQVTPPQVTTTHQTGGGTSFQPSPTSQVTTEYQPSGGARPAYTTNNAGIPTLVVSGGSGGYGTPCIIRGQPCNTYRYTYTSSQPCRQC
uniref:TIL domain containing protein n=1 Tax=Rhipicephalus zambeziensis TaxID=60191 RepID=A0A224YRQ8_9ACAR